MYSIDELHAMDRDKRLELAGSLGMKKAETANDEDVVYYILDHSAMQVAKEEASKEEERQRRPRGKRGERGERGRRGRKPNRQKEVAKETMENEQTQKISEAPVEENKERATAVTETTEAAKKTTKRRGERTSRANKAETTTAEAATDRALPPIPGLDKIERPEFPKKRGRKSRAQMEAEAKAKADYETAVRKAATDAGIDVSEYTLDEILAQAGKAGQKKKRGGRRKKEDQPSLFDNIEQNAPVASPSTARAEIAAEIAESRAADEAQAHARAREAEEAAAEETKQEAPQQGGRRMFTPRDSKGNKNKPSLDAFFGNGKGKTFKPRNQRDQHNPQPQQGQKEPELEFRQRQDVLADPIQPQAEMPIYIQDPGANSQTPKDQNLLSAGKHLSKRQRQLLMRQQKNNREHEQYNFEGILTTFGVLEIMPEGYGFLRSSDYNYLPSPDDVYLNQQQIKKYGLKTGDVVEASIRPPMPTEKYYPLCKIISVNGMDPSFIRDRVAFEHLTPLFPDEKFDLTKGKYCNISTRVVDMFAPIGKGQRALIVAPPKTGKTILLKDIANVISENHPDTYIIMLLIDERPEEVTDMARSVNAEVIASTFDEPAERHVKIADMVLQKAKRLVESGHDVVIMLDSITRLARAFNTVSPASGKILSGGVDANALQRPKRFFGAARNIENGGSLTIIATALTETSSKMDEVIFEEFKGTGNMELQLDRKLSNKRIFPAVDIIASSTRRDDLLLSEETTNRMWILRNYLADMNSQEAMEFIKKRMEMTRTNEELLVTMDK
ncbi:MAG: transcription termination factor Rho [Muribaculaceae bacterium]|nr:transcription termination factor Rho [Muribaculaceae bacterium]